MRTTDERDSSQVIEEYLLHRSSKQIISIYIDAQSNKIIIV